MAEFKGLINLLGNISIAKKAIEIILSDI